MNMHPPSELEIVFSRTHPINMTDSSEEQNVCCAHTVVRARAARVQRADASLGLRASRQ
jgi:hypothetical protein